MIHLVIHASNRALVMHYLSLCFPKFFAELIHVSASYGYIRKIRGKAGLSAVFLNYSSNLLNSSYLKAEKSAGCLFQGLLNATLGSEILQLGFNCTTRVITLKCF